MKKGFGKREFQTALMFSLFVASVNFRSLNHCYVLSHTSFFLLEIQLYRKIGLQDFRIVSQVRVKMMIFVLFGYMVALLTVKHQKNDSPQSKQHTHMYSSQ